MKTCSRCMKNKDSLDFSKQSRSKDGLKGICKECIATYTKDYRDRNKNTLNFKRRKYRKENRMTLNEYNNNYRKQHQGQYVYGNYSSLTESQKQTIRERRRMWQKELTDWYIKRRLKALGVSVTKEIIELKRQHILMIRTLKEVRKYESDRSNVQGKQHEDEEDCDGELQAGGNLGGTARV